MSEKGFEAEIELDVTPDFKEIEEKPLKKNKNKPQTVDINVLKARVQLIQSKEQRKNIFIFVLFLLILGTAGIYLSI
tara:strand:+ start:161 stop:391 length:231 start_codon:yes stop_codon:yes gene_type:complete